MQLLWYQNSKGLNNKLDPARENFDSEKGVQWFAESVNIDYDLSGRPSRRRGYSTTAITAATHSLFSLGAVCLGVSGSSLLLIGSDFDTTVLATLVGQGRMSYAVVENRIYYSNGVDKGYVLDGVVHSWAAPSTIYGPTVGRVYSTPPAGNILASHAGRIYIAAGNVLWYTEPYGPNIVDFARGSLSFDSEITMVRPVKEGMFVSTQTVVWFLRGNTPLEYVWEQAHKNTAVRGTDADFMMEDVGDQLMGIGIVWTGKDGVCIGMPDGKAVNLTSKVVTFKVGTLGAAINMGDRYICCMRDTADGVLTLALNRERVAFGQYINYTYDSFCKFGERYLGANENGVFILDVADKDGTTDISAWFKLLMTNFGFKGTKRIRFLNIAGESDGTYQVTPVADEVAGNAVEVIPENRSNRINTVKVPIGRYLRGRNWSLIVENLEGADFSIDSINVQLAGLMPD